MVGGSVIWRMSRWTHAHTGAHRRALDIEADVDRQVERHGYDVDRDMETDMETHRGTGETKGKYRITNSGRNLRCYSLGFLNLGFVIGTEQRGGRGSI